MTATIRDDASVARGGPCFVRHLESPIGPLVTAASDAGVCLLEFSIPARLEAQMHTLRRVFRGPALESEALRIEVVEGDHPHLQHLEAELHDYFAGRLTAFTVPLVAPGTPFQERVWAELLRIPYGETRSYEDIARAVATPSAQRAVGRANGTNRIAIVIPCHRVVNKGGALGGYGGLLWRKEALLGLERTGRLVLPQPSLLADPAPQGG